MTTPTLTPVADRLAKARTDLTAATTAAKLATAKRARLAAEVRALEAEAEIEAMRIQARADHERAEAAEARAAAAEATLAQERAEHLEQEREHAAELAQAEHKRSASPQRANGRAKTGGSGYTATAEPSSRSGAPAALAIVPTPEEPG